MRPQIVQSLQAEQLDLVALSVLMGLYYAVINVFPPPLPPMKIAAGVAMNVVRQAIIS